MKEISKYIACQEMICEKAKAENGIRGCTDEERSCNFT
jgi:hypothetical protein